MTIKVRWLGHSAFLLHIDGNSVLIDPFLTNNPLGAVAPEDLSPDVILLSHAHGDHLGDTVQIAKRTGAGIVTNFEISNYMSDQGIEDVMGLNPGGTADLDYMTVKFTRAFHSSSFPDGRYGGVPCGFIITEVRTGKRIYFAGDTELFSDMALYAEPKLDLAMLPIGDHFTMGPDDSIKALHLIKPTFVMPMHYNTFPPIAQNAADWALQVNTHTSTQPIVLDPGGEFSLE